MEEAKTTSSMQAVEFIDREEVGKRLRIDPLTVYVLTKKGVIKGAKRVGRSLRWDWNVVLANLPDFDEVKG
jgi:hypothetical protein